MKPMSMKLCNHILKGPHPRSPFSKIKFMTDGNFFANSGLHYSQPIHKSPTRSASLNVEKKEKNLLRDT